MLDSVMQKPVTKVQGPEAEALNLEPHLPTTVWYGTASLWVCHEKASSQPLMLMMLARRLRKEKQTAADALDAGPEGWERRSRRPLMLMMLARRAGKGEAYGR